MLTESLEFKHFRNAFAENKAPLTIIMGAGLSVPAGLPTWPGLEKKLRKDVQQKRNSMGALQHEFKKGEYSALDKSTDPWVSFQLIKNILGAPTFESCVQEYLNPGDDAEIPEGYAELLKLNPNSFVSLNLDRFAGTAAAESEQRYVTPIYGKEIAEKWTAYFQAQPSIVYLHGDIYNPSTWVLTKSELDALVSSEGHRMLIENAYLNNIVLFVGLSADDASLSLPLLRLNEKGFKPPQVYWFTDRMGEGLEEWADKHRVRMIRYSAKTDDDHLAAIKSLVSQSLSSQPDEPETAPIKSSVAEIEEEVDPDKLVRRQPEDIRKYVAAKVNRIIENSEEEALYENYREFCQANDFALHQAFYRPNSGAPVKWFDYEIELPSIGRGNFGEVYSATGSDGKLVAVKIMNKEAFDSDEMLGGFRRGVRSMKHVEDGQVGGMTYLIEAFEIPPTIVMPFVSGLSLQEILDQEYTMSWLTKLRIIEKVGGIVSDAHALPSTVMHRDLKPSNIMIQDYDYSENFDPDVVVLDFDMSWHKGSKEKDIIFESRDDFGYLAPEQTVGNGKYHPRNTKVDSYGLGMTAFALYSGLAPLANEPLNPDWGRKVLETARRGYDHAWISAPNRLARSIGDATKVDQAERKDFFRLTRQLHVILQAIESPDQLDDADAWGEELLASVDSSIPYQWDDQARSGVLMMPGAKVSVEADPKDGQVTVKLEYVDEGMQKRSNIKQFLTESCDKIARILKQGGWEIEIKNVMMSSLVVSAKSEISDLKRKDKLFEAFSIAVGALRS